MNYTINFSDPSKADSITVSSNTIDTSTPLQLIGYETTEYGNEYWTNILRIMEHFSSKTAPSNALIGQMWYRSSDSSVLIYQAPNEWIDLSNDNIIDTTNYISTYTSNTVTNLKLADDESGDTVYSGETKNSNHAATKQFADNYKSCGIKNVTFSDSDITYSYTLYPNKFVVMNGVNTSSGYKVMLPFTMKDNDYAVVCTNTDKTMHYSITNKAPDTFTPNGNNWLLVGYTL